MAAFAHALGCADWPSGQVAIPPSGTDGCAPMCERLQTLGCLEGQPVYNAGRLGPVGVANQSCVDHCVEFQQKGFFFNTWCVQTAQSCASIELARTKDPEDCKKELEP